MVSAPWRRAFYCSLIAAPVILGSGCKTASGWRMPWSSWGGMSSPSATALTITKPSTHAPAPNGASTQPGAGLASSSGTATHGAGLGGNAPPGGYGATGGSAPTGGIAGYPGTALANSYPAQPASNSQPGGSVAPAGGLQVGPYGMQAPPSGYGSAQPRGVAANPVAYGGASRNSPAGPSTTEAPYGREDYRTAEQPEARRGAVAGTTDNSGAPAESESVYGGGEGPATATETSPYGATEETSPAEGSHVPAYSNPESTSSRSFGPPNTVSGARPSTSPPSGAAGTGLPPSLSNVGGYRPGSTAGGYSARNAGFEQPQNAAAPEEPTGGIYR